jgi:hypothetical protein
MFLQKLTWMPQTGGGTRNVLKDFFVGKKKSPLSVDKRDSNV